MVTGNAHFDDIRCNLEFTDPPQVEDMMDIGEHVNDPAQTVSKLKVTVSSSVHELLNCPVCSKAMHPPIHQCSHGHTLCSGCKPKMHNRCPTCRHELGDIRCLALEQVATSLELPCNYQSFGCTAFYPYYSKLNHEGQCVFRPYNCPYVGSKCTVIGDIPNLAFLRFMGDDNEAKNYSYTLEVGGNARKIIWQGVPRSIRDSHRKVCDSFDGLIVQRNIGFFFSGGDRKELKLRVTGRIWKEQ